MNELDRQHQQHLDRISRVNDPEPPSHPELYEALREWRWDDYDSATLLDDVPKKIKVGLGKALFLRDDGAILISLEYDHTACIDLFRL